MTARGRKRAEGPATEVAAFEFYPTPREAIIPLIASPLLTLPGGTWIDPCAGSGRIPSTVNAMRADVAWLLVEINPDHRPALMTITRAADVLLPFGDFVHRPWSHDRADVLIMNPPFSHAHDFVRAALARARVVLMLQRQGWFGTQERSPWLRAHCPDVFTLPKRPSFTPDGGTDSAEYAWFHWPTSAERRCGQIAVLDNPRQPSLFGAVSP